MKTERQILDLKQSATEVRDKVIQAGATLKEIEANIIGYEKELSDLGVKPNKENQTVAEKASEAMSEMEQKIDDLYAKSEEKLNEWNE